MTGGGGADEPPRIIAGRYRIERPLGQGAMGAVYEVVHLELHRTFALKLMTVDARREPVVASRFQREAAALGRLKHPNIVDVADAGLDPETHQGYLVMERLEGITLADLCRREGPLPLARALPILEDVARAVDHAHAAGILHRDLKPSNIFLCPGPSGATVATVLDFGLARFVGAGPASDRSAPSARPMDGADKSLTTTGSLIGTPAYVAPELIAGLEATPASDIYSFGIVAYEMLVGRPPFDGSVEEVLAAHRDREPPARDGSGSVSVEVYEVLRRPLEKDPSRRPRRAGEVVDQLRLAQDVTEARRRKVAHRKRCVWLSPLMGAGAALASMLVAASPPGRSAESAFEDARIVLSPPRLPDPRILLVTVDEATLAADPTALAERGSEFGRTLERVFAAGARAVALDLLLPATWSRARPFADLVMTHPDALTLAAFSSPASGSVVGVECLDEFVRLALGPRRTSALFGFVNVEEHHDGTVRRARATYLTEDGRVQDSWAMRAAKTVDAAVVGGAGTFVIDSRLDWRRFERISWKDVPRTLDRAPARFRGRLVLVGGDFLGSGDDEHRVAGPRGVPRRVSGLVFQAMVVDTLLSGLRVRESSWRVAAVAAALLASVSAFLVLSGRRRVLWFPILAVALYGALATWLFAGHGRLLPLTLPLSTMTLGVLGALFLRGRLGLPPPEPAPAS